MPKFVLHVRKHVVGFKKLNKIAVEKRFKDLIGNWKKTDWMVTGRLRRA